MGLHNIVRGVPKDLVLGPVLRNIGYMCFLRGVFVHGVSCYADDTLVTARAQDLRNAPVVATAGAAEVVRIQRLGLKVALHISEDICLLRLVSLGWRNVCGS